MAAVDSFELLWREISQYFSDVRDVLAVIGAYYVTQKSLTVIGHAAEAFYVYFWSRLADDPDLRQKYGPWAVVTGSSDGIGKAYARELARRGMNIVLLSREEKKLLKTAEEIKDEFSVEVEYVKVDFAADVKGSLYDTIWEALAGKEIGILVNNVGVMYDYPQPFLDVPERKLWQLIYVNVAAATMMTHLVLPQMVKRKKGAIVTISSGSCSHVTPLMTAYSATKSYLDYFSKGLEYEYSRHGIDVQCLMPYYVATRMTRYSDALSKTSFFIPSAAAFAQSAVRTLGYSSRTSGYFSHVLQDWLFSVIPEWLYTKAAFRLNTALGERAKLKLQHRPSYQIPTSLSTQSFSDDPS